MAEVFGHATCRGMIRMIVHVSHILLIYIYMQMGTK